MPGKKAGGANIVDTKNVEAIQENVDLMDDDIDFNYSCTQLEDFLKSQNHMKNTNVQSSQLLNTFLSSYSKMRSTNFKESIIQGVANSRVEMKPIAELEQSESETNTVKDQEDSEEDLGRSGEDIDLNKVDVKSSASSVKKSKPILSQEEVKKAQGEVKPSQTIQLDVNTKQGFKEIMRF